MIVFLKNKEILFILIFFIFVTMNSCQKANDFPELQKLYSNQELPGSTPKIFSPGLVSSEHQEHSSLAFSPDGKQLWWSRWRLPHDLDKYPQIIKFIKFENGSWSKPITAPFSGKYRDGSPAFSPDGNRIYFYSRRPLDNTESIHDNDIWYAEKVDNGWEQPVNLGKPVNTSFVEATPCIVTNGNLYFTSNRNQYKDPTGNNDLFVSEFINGNFHEPKSVGNAINTSYARESFPYVSPDESYIIFSRDNRTFDSEGNILNGERKLMISFKNKNGSWIKAIDMGPSFKKTRFPSVSPDGKFLFFTKYSDENNEDFYWVDAKIIDELKPDYSK
jgi:Tol biopolymer transport system component